MLSFQVCVLKPDDCCMCTITPDVCILRGKSLNIYGVGNDSNRHYFYTIHVYRNALIITAAPLLHACP